MSGASETDWPQTLCEALWLPRKASISLRSFGSAQGKRIEQTRLPHKAMVPKRTDPQQKVAARKKKGNSTSTESLWRGCASCVPAAMQ